MDCKDFNKKWAKYLEPRFYGMAINDSEVIQYLDSEFEKEILVNSDFMFSQIKVKFGTSRVYADSDNCMMWEDKIDSIMYSKK